MWLAKTAEIRQAAARMNLKERVEKKGEEKVFYVR
jgi:hypothetical protein